MASESNSNVTDFSKNKVVEMLDYAQGIRGLLKPNVLKFLLEDNCSIVVRPSGTEPKLKIKIYVSVSAKNKQEAEKIEKKYY